MNILYCSFRMIPTIHCLQLKFIVIRWTVIEKSDQVFSFVHNFLRLNYIISFIVIGWKVIE